MLVCGIGIVYLYQVGKFGVFDELGEHDFGRGRLVDVVGADETDVKRHAGIVRILLWSGGGLVLLVMLNAVMSHLVWEVVMTFIWFIVWLIVNNIGG